MMIRCMLHQKTTERIMCVQARTFVTPKLTGFKYVQSQPPMANWYSGVLKCVIVLDELGSYCTDPPPLVLESDVTVTQR
jgi:hypothetical protein